MCQEINQILIYFRWNRPLSAYNEIRKCTVHWQNAGREYISLIRTCKGRNDNDNNGEEVEVDYHPNESMPMQNKKFVQHE